MTTATATPTTDERIAARRAALTKARAERKDGDDLPRTMTTREVREYLAETAKIDKQIADLNAKADALAALPTTLDADTKWLANVTTWRTTISDELLAIKSPIRSRDLMELAQRLEFSIALIDHGFGISKLGPIISLSSARVGELMRQVDYETEGTGLHGPSGWRGSIKQVEARIKEVTKRRADAHAALDVLLRTDEEKTTQAAEDKAFHEVMKTMQCKADSTGTRLVAFTLDGDLLEQADMTEAQRKAFERFEAAHFGPREVVSV